MGMTITSREFNRDVSAAKRAAKFGPVTITDHGRPAHVLLTVEDYERLAGRQELMGDLIWTGQDPTVQIELPERRVEPARELDL